MRKGHKQDTEGSFIFWVILTVKTPGSQEENVLERDRHNSTTDTQNKGGFVSMTGVKSALSCPH